MGYLEVWDPGNEYKEKEKTTFSCKRNKSSFYGIIEKNEKLESLPVEQLLSPVPKNVH